MKKYNYLILSSALLVASLAIGKPTQALGVNESTNPQQKASNVTIAVEGDTAHIDYSRSTVQKNYSISHAVWSDEGGQDDLVWYTASQQARTSLDLSRHKGYGKFHVHTYIHINGKTIGLNATSFTLEKPTQKTIANLNGTTLAVTYPRNKDQKNATIRHTIWSHENGKDDVKTYLANGNTSVIDLSQHKGYGTYSVETSVLENGKTTLLSTSNFEVAQPQVTILSNSSETGVLDISIQNVPDHIYEILLPTWSDNKGQDDLKWYTARRNSDGSFGLRIYLKDHHFDTGNYFIHCYAKSFFKQNTHFLGANTASIATGNIPSLDDMKPNIQFDTSQVQNGHYTISLQETQKSKKIKSIQVPVWSKSDQSNLKWYQATNNGNGSFSVPVDFKQHQYHSSIYNQHIYITYEDGSQASYILDQVDLSSARLPLSISNTFVSTGQFQTTIDNAFGEGEVLYAVWSEENGQDDLRWYTAQKANTGRYSGAIPLDNHSGTGLYHLHVYQDGRGATSTFTVEQHHIQQTLKTYPVTEANTYPVGQCTWGAKEIAPWVHNWWGNAGDWATSAARAGFRVGNTPQVGAVICWTDGGYGHVGVVTHVQSANRIQIKEANYAGKQYVSNFRGWFDPQNSVTPGRVTYIYPK